MVETTAKCSGDYQSPLIIFLTPVTASNATKTARDRCDPGRFARPPLPQRGDGGALHHGVGDGDERERAVGEHIVEYLYSLLLEIL